MTRNSHLCWVYLLSLPSLLLADGKFFPDKAYKVPPDIPYQRAAIIFKDNTEKLIVESTLDGPGSNFGWIIPVPAKPTHFEKITPGFLNTLTQEIQPNIIKHSPHLIYLSIILCITVSAWLTSIVVNKPKSSIGRICLFVVILLFFSCLLFPPLSANRHQSIMVYSNLKIHETTIIGSYDITVLEPKDSATLNHWLTQNEYISLSNQELPIIDTYINDKWLFVAARLTRNNTGISTPHPLAITFPTIQPIYPMRLTGTLNQSLYLDLFVIAEKSAQHPNLITEFSNQFIYDDNDAPKNYHTKEVIPNYDSKNYNMTLGHPLCLREMWDNCTITRLAASLTPKQMNEDIIINFKPPQPYRKTYYTHKSALMLSTYVTLNLWWIALFSLSLIAGSSRQSWNNNMIKKPLLLLVFICISVFAIFYFSVSKTNVRNEKWYVRRFAPGSSHSLYKDFKKENPVLSNLELGAIKTRAAEYFASINETGEFYFAFSEDDDSPGRCNIIDTADGLVMRFYAPGGIPYDYPLKTTDTESISDKP